MPKSLEVFSLSNVPRVIRGETLLGTVVRVVLWFSLSSCTSMDIPDSVQEPITHINPEQTLIARITILVLYLKIIWMHQRGTC
jgi:hypothetical protein